MISSPGFLSIKAAEKFIVGYLRSVADGLFKMQDLETLTFR
jgi:hypothetical protein